MPVPQCKKSKSRTRHRRAQHDKVAAKTLGECENCGAPKLNHSICMSCGTYKGRQLVRIVNS